jgi:hypothetical protein
LQAPALPLGHAAVAFISAAFYHATQIAQKSSSVIQYWMMLIPFAEHLKVSRE